MPDVAFAELLLEPLRNGVSYPSRTRGEGVRMVNMREIFAYDRITSEVECELVPLTEAERRSARLKPDDLLFARQSLTFEGAGKVSLVTDGSSPTWDSHLIRARLDPTRADPAYYYYFFRSAEGRRRMEVIIHQVAAAGIRGSDLARLRVPSPPLAEQRRIAEVLGALDDKVAANTALAAAADSLMRAEYEMLDAPYARVDSVATSPRVKANPVLLAPQETYVGLEHLGRRNMWLSHSGTARQVTSAKSRFERRDVLFGKLRPYFHKVVGAPSNGICSTDILVLRARDRADASLLLAAVSSDPVVNEVVAASEGTRMPRTSWKDLASVPIRWPRGPARAAMSARLDSIRDSTEAVLRESRTLTETRDALLPHLMSGKLRVRDAEALASISGA